MKKILIISIIVLVATKAMGTNYYVSETGNDGNDGLSIADAWASIDNGDQLGVMLPGDTVLIYPGAYNITDKYLLTQSGTAVAPIVYRRIGKGEARIDANFSANEVLLVEGNHIEVQGLHLLNAKNDAMFMKGDSCLVSYCYMISPGKRGIRTEGNYNLFYRNVIAYSTEEGIKNEDAGKFGNRYYNNTIYQSARRGIEIKSNVEDCRIWNCIVVNSGDVGILAPSTTVCAYNNVFDNAGGNYDGVADSAGGISSPPQFVDSTMERFDLSAGASEIDAGYDLGFSFNRSAPDMGAFEKYNAYYVSPDGDDANSGSSQITAWQTIDNGDSLLYPGDTIYVLPGTYADSLIITDSGTPDDPIVYLGVRDSCLVDGEGYFTSVEIDANYILWSGIDISGASDHNLTVSGEYNIIDRCKFSDAGRHGLEFASSNNVVSWCVFVNNQLVGVHVEADSIQIVHCTFYNSGTMGIDALGSQNNTITNCIFQGLENANVAVRASAESELTYSAIFNHKTPVQGGIELGAGMIDTDPLLIEPDSGNYRQSSLSPGLDAGIDVGMTYLGPAPDMGAYEAGLPTSLTITPVYDSLFADSVYQFSVSAIDSEGYPANSGELTWSQTFATGAIDTTGLLTPNLVGSGTIIVLSSLGGLADTSAILDVVPGTLDSLYITPYRDTINSDSTRQFSANGFDIKSSAK